MEYFYLCLKIIEEEKKKFNLSEKQLIETLSKFSDLKCFYENPYFRCAHMYKYGTITLYFINDCVKKFLNEYSQIDELLLGLKSSSNLTFCSLSSGPALDYVGFTLGMIDVLRTDLQLSFSDVNVISSSCQWKNTYKIMKESILLGFIGFQVIKLCDNFNIIQDTCLSFKDKHKNLVQNADILFMNKMTIPNSEADIGAWKIYLKDLIDAMKDNSLLFCIHTKPNVDIIAEFLYKVPGEYIFKPINNSIKFPENYPNHFMEQYGCLPNFSNRGWFFVWKKLPLSLLLTPIQLSLTRSSLSLNGENKFLMNCFNEYLNDCGQLAPGKFDKPSNIYNYVCVSQSNDLNAIDIDVENDVKMLIEEICDFIDIKYQTPLSSQYVSYPIIQNENEIKKSSDSNSSTENFNLSKEIVGSSRKRGKKKNKCQINSTIQNSDTNSCDLKNVQTDSKSDFGDHSLVECGLQNDVIDSCIQNQEKEDKNSEILNKKSISENHLNFGDSESLVLTKKNNKMTQTGTFTITDDKSLNANHETKLKIDKTEVSPIQLLSDRIRNLVATFENLLQKKSEHKFENEKNDEFQNATNSSPRVCCDINGTCEHKFVSKNELDKNFRNNVTCKTECSHCDSLQMGAYSGISNPTCVSYHRQICRMINHCSCQCACLKRNAHRTCVNNACCATASSYHCFNEASTFKPSNPLTYECSSQIENDDSPKIVIPLQNISKEALAQITEILKVQSKSTV